MKANHRGIQSLCGILLLMQTQVLYSQQKAQFELPIYFEDARGNKDSVVVGYDRSIKAPESFNPEFGENYLYTPFDSVLEVRVTEYPFNYTSKKMVEGVFEANDGTCENYGYPFRILVQAKYLPLRVYWDSTILEGVCHRNTVLSAFRLLLTLPQHNFDVISTYCMQYQSSVEAETFGAGTPNEGALLKTDWEVEGKVGKQKIPTYYFLNYNWKLNYCEEHVTNTAAPASALPVAVWPNPVSGDLQVQWQETDGSPLLFRMYALNGTPVLEQRLSQNPGQIHLDGLSNGVYYLQAPGYETRRVVVLR